MAHIGKHRKSTDGIEMSKQTRLYIRVHAEKAGGHVHCNIFSGNISDRTLGKNGTIVFDVLEWPMARERLDRFADEVIYLERY